MNYSLESWLLEGLYLDKSRIQGFGVFTSRMICAGTTVVRWGGTVFTSDEVRNGLVRPHTYVGIGRDLYLANPPDKPPSLDDHMNHSCDPNLWMIDEVSLSTRKTINAGEELTADYAMWLNNTDYVMMQECNCCSSLCRHRITGLDWKIPELQWRYQNHFSPFINECILTQKSTNETSQKK